MTTKTHPVRNFLATMAVIAALVALAPLVLKTGGDGHPVTVTAIWNPSPRTEGVALRITVGGVPQLDVVATVAPVVRSYTVPRGTRVEIYARLQGDHRAELGCSISVDGAEVVNEFKKSAGPTEPVACWLNV